MRPTKLSVLLLFIALASCQTKLAQNQHKKVKSQGVKINYGLTGRGDTTLLFVHGWGINQTYWDAQVRHFSRKYKVLTFDLPGFGQSVPVNGKPEKTRKN